MLGPNSTFLTASVPAVRRVIGLGLLLLVSGANLAAAAASDLATIAEVKSPAAAVDLRPVFDQRGLARSLQGSRPTCSAFTVAGALEFAVARQEGQTPRLSVEFLNWASNQACGDKEDGGFFSDLWRGFSVHGICMAEKLPYQAVFDAARTPPPEALADARTRLDYGLRLNWIKEWNVNTGLTEAHILAIKRTLSEGWPVCGGFRWPKAERWVEDVLQMFPAEAVRDGHSVLLVGYRDDAQQPGGGVFIFRNTAKAGRDGYMPYGYARDYMNDAVWIDYAAAPVVAAQPGRLRELDRGFEQHEFKVDDTVREALIYVPAWARTNRTPVVFVFHGHGGTARNAARSFAMDRHWPEAISVHMQGIPTPGRLTDPQGRKPGWQGRLGDQGDRDLKFFDAVLSRLKQDYRVDEKRIYATGHSNGGGFTYLLWGARGEVFAAVAPSAAATGVRNALNLRPKPAMHLAGERDALVKFEWQKLTMDAVRKLNGCALEGKRWADQATIYESTTGTPFVTFIHPGGHQFPAAGPALIARFFKGHSLEDEKETRNPKQP